MQSPSPKAPKVYQGPSNIYIEILKKTKKNEPKMVPQLILVDKEAFGSEGGDNAGTVRALWTSQNNRIIVARKIDSKSIVGYAAFFVQDPKVAKKGKAETNPAKGSYLLRIAVRGKCQRQGIGCKLMDFLFTNYPAHLALDVSTNNTTGCAFYEKIGLQVEKVYPSGKDQVEFATFVTPPGYKYTPRTHKAKLETEENKSASTVSSSEEDEVTKDETRVFNDESMSTGQQVDKTLL